MLSTQIHPLLRAQGFQRRVRTWSRMVDELVQLVNVQGSVGSQRAWALFYVNLGVFSPAVWRLWWGREPPPLFDRTWCPWWNRLEHDVEGIVRRDLWQITEE